MSPLNIEDDRSRRAAIVGMKYARHLCFIVSGPRSMALRVLGSAAVAEMVAIAIAATLLEQPTEAIITGYIRALLAAQRERAPVGSACPMAAQR